MAGTGKNTPPGPGVDASGQAVIDPTQNVKDLLTAAMQRQDDLRDLDKKWMLRLMQVDMGHNKELRKAEAKRIDAIRMVDVNASAVERAAVETRAATLAKQVTDASDALRVQVQETANVAAINLRTELLPIKADVEKLRDEFNKQQGERSQVTESREATTGSRQGIGLWIAAASIGVAVVFGIVGVAITFILRG